MLNCIICKTGRLIVETEELLNTKYEIQKNGRLKKISEEKDYSWSDKDRILKCENCFSEYTIKRNEAYDFKNFNFEKLKEKDLMKM